MEEHLVGKGKILVTCIFSFSNIFLPIKDIYHHFNNISIYECKCFQCGQVKMFLVWYRHFFLTGQTYIAGLFRPMVVLPELEELFHCLLILEALPPLPLDIWQSWQRFRNKMAEAANENWVEEWALLIWHLFLLSCANVRVFTFW